MVIREIYNRNHSCLQRLMEQADGYRDYEVAKGGRWLRSYDNAPYHVLGITHFIHKQVWR